MKRRFFSLILSMALMLSTIDSSAFVQAKEIATGTAIESQEVSDKSVELSPTDEPTESVPIESEEVSQGNKDLNDKKETKNVHITDDSKSTTKIIQKASNNIQAISSSSDSIIEIASEIDLLELVEQGKSGEITGSYKLTRDISLSTSNWVSIGSSSTYSFAGEFDGNGYKISGVKTSGTDSVAGLFGYNKGTIKNLTVSGSLIDGRNYAGVLCAYNTGTIQECNTTGSINSTVNRGGLAGCNSSKGVIIQCKSSVNVSGNGYNAGGLVGENDGIIRYSYATGSVSGSSYVGGCVGKNYGTVTCSYASGTVTSNNNSYVGGLVGYNNGNISYCYARGSVNGGSGCGLAYGGDETVFYCYYNSVNTGGKAGFAESTSRLNRQETYYGWDFDHVWAMGEDGYPCISLRGEAGEIEIVGSGAEDDPYIIENEKQLFALASNQLSVNGKKYYRLGNDIEITADNWTPIGNYNRRFNGVFDGAGYTVTGLKSTGTEYDYIGLFGFNEGTIKNISVSGDVSKGSNSYVGLLCAYNNKGTVDNCSVEGSISSES